ncbi:hypothetical protein KCP74_21775 [Salmonella enterica subsp. enterica]|nr:hypothetical protein KCP74_21775 [Salmonella enterica subsp. enterica]
MGCRADVAPAGLGQYRRKIRRLAVNILMTSPATVPGVMIRGLTTKSMMTNAMKEADGVRRGLAGRVLRGALARRKRRLKKFRQSHGGAVRPMPRSFPANGLDDDGHSVWRARRRCRSDDVLFSGSVRRSRNMMNMIRC